MDAFDGLYAALAGRIRGYLLSQCRDSALADDLLQETFMQTHRSRRTYQPGRPVTPWIFAIARHVYLMNRRSAGRCLRFEETPAADARSSDVPRDDLRAFVDADRLRRALRESVPGRALSTPALSRGLAGRLALPVLVYRLTAGAVGLPEGSGWTIGLICFRTSAAAAVPALIGAAILVARAFPLRPGIAGALYGWAAG